MKSVSEFRQLLSLPGQKALAAAKQLAPEGQIEATTIVALRKHYGVLLSALAVEMNHLRVRAKQKFGHFADRLYFTSQGLEMASHPLASAYHASLIQGKRVADLCCGIGADLIAFAQAGFDVTGIERDELTAAIAEANLAAFQLPGRVIVADAMSVSLTDFDMIFADPARRQTGKRVLSAEDAEPPLSILHQRALASKAPLLVKLAPGVPRAELEAYADATLEFISVERELKECLIQFGMRHPPRRAVVELPSQLRFAGVPGEPMETRPLGAFLVEPHPGIPRADLLGQLAEETNAAPFEPGIALLTADQPVSHPFARCLEIVQAGSVDAKQMNAWLRAGSFRVPTILNRGSQLDPGPIQKRMKGTGTRECWLVLTKYRNGPYALLTLPPLL